MGAIRAQDLRCSQHVGAFQQAVYVAFADTQGTQNQGPVRNRFITGHGDRALQAGSIGCGGMGDLDGHGWQLPSR